MTRELNVVRNALGRYLSTMVAADPQAAERFVKDSHGRYVVLPALDSDSIVTVSAMVARRGGTATIAVLSAPSPDESEPASIRLLDLKTKTGAAGDGDSHIPVGPACTLGDMFKILVPGSSMTLRMDGSELKMADRDQGITDVPRDFADSGC